MILCHFLYIYGKLQNIDKFCQNHIEIARIPMSMYFTKSSVQNKKSQIGLNFLYFVFGKIKNIKNQNLNKVKNLDFKITN